MKFTSSDLARKRFYFLFKWTVPLGCRKVCTATPYHPVRPPKIGETSKYISSYTSNGVSIVLRSSRLINDRVKRKLDHISDAK